MTTLIIGRTGSGKDALREILQREYGWTFVQSYTTRPQRSAEDGRSHIFLTQREADRIQDRMAYTNINGYDYFSTREQVEAADGYIIDPRGADMLLGNDPDGYYQIVYMRPGDKDVQRSLSIGRADDPEKEARVFEARAASESDQFDRFEACLDNGEPEFPGHSNYEVLQFVNTYEEKDLRQLAADLEGHKRFRGNAGVMLRDLMAAGIMKHDEAMLPVMTMPDGSQEPIPVSLLCGYFREKPEILGDMVYRWMSMPQVVLERAVPDPPGGADA